MPGAQQGAAAGQEGPVRPQGLLQEMQALVVGFFTSLMPGVQPLLACHVLIHPSQEMGLRHMQ